MPRRQLIELEDQPWWPASIRDAMTDFLAFALNTGRQYRSILPRLAAALDATGSRRIVDLCSGAGGPWPGLLPALERLAAEGDDGGDGDGAAIEVVLTDRFPNLSAGAAARRRGRSGLRFHPEPVDACRLPPDLAGFRTLFTSFHHFPPHQARAIVADAVARRQGIGVFEITQRSATAIVLFGLFVPLVVLAGTPFIRPFRWSRLVWTYLLPVVPLASLFDGIVSCLRSYTPDELAALAEEAVAEANEANQANQANQATQANQANQATQANQEGAGGRPPAYRWQVGEQRYWWGLCPVPITYLIGEPLPDDD